MFRRLVVVLAISVCAFGVVHAVRGRSGGEESYWSKLRPQNCLVRSDGAVFALAAPMLIGEGEVIGASWSRDGKWYAAALKRKPKKNDDEQRRQWMGVPVQKQAPEIQIVVWDRDHRSVRSLASLPKLDWSWCQIEWFADGAAFALLPQARVDGQMATELYLVGARSGAIKPVQRLVGLTIASPYVLHLGSLHRRSFRRKGR